MVSKKQACNIFMVIFWLNSSAWYTYLKITLPSSVILKTLPAHQPYLPQFYVLTIEYKWAILKKLWPVVDFLELDNLIKLCRLFSLKDFIYQLMKTIEKVYTCLSILFLIIKEMYLPILVANRPICNIIMIIFWINFYLYL